MGLFVLEQFNKQGESRIVEDPSENLRRKKAREHARDIYREVSLNKDDFFLNVDKETEHMYKIDHIQVTKNGKYFTTTSKDAVIIWQLTPEIKLLKRLDLKSKDDEEGEDGKPPPVPHAKVIANLDNDCT
mmetsp:Transcript_20791/g.32052  ORF Transcript_20791/g.32052 Transcript_20791/m.32052 type:complete len:130 (+) Transcript_20791:1240-1629(+)